MKPDRSRIGPLATAALLFLFLTAVVAGVLIGGFIILARSIKALALHLMPFRRTAGPAVGGRGRLIEGRYVVLGTAPAPARGPAATGQ